MYNDYKQVMVIRTDLGMGKGKMCGQVAHASVSAFVKSTRTVNKTLAVGYSVFDDNQPTHKAASWYTDGQTKIVCKVDSEIALEEVANKAEAAGFIVSRIHDAGRTQLDPGTLTCIGIGPDKTEIIDPITKDLKLL